MFKRASLLYAVKLFFVIFTSIVVSSCSRNESKPGTNKDHLQQNESKKEETEEKNLHILVSNPLAGLFGKLKRQFIKEEPQISLTISTTPEFSLGNKVKTGQTNIDFIATTDYKSLQQHILAPKLSNFITLFATDEIVVAWSKQSSFSDKIDMDNWQWIFGKKEVTFGHANPATDICGLRTTMVWDLADKYYRRKIKKETIREWMESALRKKIVRPSILQILPLLSTGTVDYIFIYRSLAEQHNLPYIKLRPNINLAHWKHKKKYSRTTISGRTGEVVCFSFTIPTKCPNPASSNKFGNFILSKTGSDILRESGLNSISGGATMFTTGTMDIPIGR